MNETSASTPATQTAHWCPSCEEIVEPVPVYECNNCGTEGTERRCENCNKFAARRDEDGCESCLGETEEIEIVKDHDGALVPLSDYDPEGPALSDRRRAARETADADAAAKREAKTAAAVAGASEVPWGAVTPGMRVLVKDWSGKIDPNTSATVLSAVTAGPSAQAPVRAGTVLVTLQHHGPRAEVHDADDVALVLGSEADAESVAVARRFTLGACPWVAGTGLRVVSVGFDKGGAHTGGVPVAEVYGRYSQSSGAYTRLGTFVDPEAARAFAAAASSAAADPRLADEGDAQPVEEESDVIGEAYPTYGADFAVGLQELDEDKYGVELLISTSPRSATSTRFTDASVLRRVAEAAVVAAERLEAALGLR